MSPKEDHKPDQASAEGSHLFQPKTTNPDKARKTDVLVRNINEADELRRTYPLVMTVTNTDDNGKTTEVTRPAGRAAWIDAVFVTGAALWDKHGMETFIELFQANKTQPTPAEVGKAIAAKVAK